MFVLPPLPILLEILPAALVAGVLLLVAGIPKDRNLRRAGAGAAIGVGTATAIGIVLGRPPELPGASLPVTDWPFHLALGGAVVGAVAALARAALAVRAGLALAVTAGAAAVLLGPLPEPGLVEIGAVALTGGVAWILLDALADRRPGPDLPIILSLVSFAAVQAMIHAHGAKIGQMTGALSAACGAGVAVGLLWRGLSLARGGVAVYSLLITGGLVISVFYDSMPKASAATLLAAPLFAWVGEVPWLARRPAIVRIGVSALLVAAVAVAAVGLSYAANPPDEYGYY